MSFPRPLASLIPAILVLATAPALQIAGAPIVPIPPSIQAGAAAYAADILTDRAAYEEMIRLSGQTKAPTMRWGEEILADFGATELDAFLRERKIVR